MTPAVTTPKVHPRRGGRPRIDWAAAKAYFIELGRQRTYAAVAEAFGVSEAAVRKHAHAERWDGRAAELDAEIARRLEERAILTLEQRRRRALAVVDRALHTADAKLEQGTLEIRLADIPNLVKLAELLEGEATERVEVAQVQAVFVATGQLLVERLAERLQLEANGAGVLDPAGMVAAVRESYRIAVNEAVAGIEGGGE